MLTIQNPRKDVHHINGFESGGYRLVDGGLSGGGLDHLSPEAPYYTFFWSYGDEPVRKIKVRIQRTPVTDDPNRISRYGISYGVQFYKKVNNSPTWEEIWKDIINRNDIIDSKKFYLKMLASIEWLKKRGLC